MYCRYSVFFSFRTAYTSFPGTFVFFVLLKLANPIIRRIIAASGSESSSTSIFEGASAALGLAGVEEVVPLVFGKGVVALGPFGAALVGGGERDVRDDLVGPEGGGLDDEPGGGERVRIDALGSRAGDRERER